MDSEADSSFTPSTLFENTSKQSRSQVSSAVWTHCRAPRDDDEDPDPKWKYCTHCTTPPIYFSNISSNMRRHLKRRHNINVEIAVGRVQATTVQQLEQLYLRAKLSDQTEEIDAQVFEKQLNQDIINEALVSLIVVRNLPFRMVEWPEFHTFCQVLNPKSDSFITTAHSQIGRKIREAWQTHKDTVRKKLQSALSSIHLSVDIWTSPNRHLLLAVTADFVDYIEEKHVKALLALRTVKGHSGEEQFAVLLPVLQDYGIVQKLGAVVADNSGTNDTLCQEIEAYLLNTENLVWESSQWRLRCLGHIINLAVQAFLFHNVIRMEEMELYDESEESEELGDEMKQKFRLLGPLGKLHNIIVNIRSSPGRTAEFLKLASRMIPLDNRTRWNSWYLSLIVADTHAPSIDTYTKSHFADLSEDYLTPQDWTRLRMIMTFLQPFHRATLETQGHRATLEKVLFTMDILVQYFKTALVSKYNFSFLLERFSRPGSREAVKTYYFTKSSCTNIIW
jgi:hypothetical protein